MKVLAATTAHEGSTYAAPLDVLKRAAAGGANLIDVIAYPFITELEPILQKYPVAGWGKYESGLKIHDKVAADDPGKDRHVTLIHAQGPAGQVRRLQDHAARCAEGADPHG